VLLTPLIIHITACSERPWVVHSSQWNKNEMAKIALHLQKIKTTSKKKDNNGYVKLCRTKARREAKVKYTLNLSNQVLYRQNAF
jgi:hypothetical protein